MLNFPMVLATSFPNTSHDSVIPQNHPLHILSWPHDVLRLIGRMLPRQDAIQFTSSCALLFTLRFKAGGHGILYEQRWKRTSISREAICSTLALEGRTTVDWPTVKNYAPAITALTLNFSSLSYFGLASLTADLQALTTLTKLNIACLKLSEKFIMPLLSTACQFSQLQSLMIKTYTITSLPTKLWQLNNLHSLTINTNLEVLPAELGRLSNLQRLEIRGNCLTSLPAELGQLSNLQRLAINGNYLTSLPAELGQLSNLKSLKIWGDNVDSLPVELGQLNNLQLLKISGDNLDFLPIELGQLSNLQFLSINADRLKTLPAALGQLSKLQRLKITGSKLTSLPAELVRLGYSLDNFIFNRQRRVKGKIAGR